MSHVKTNFKKTKYEEKGVLYVYIKKKIYNECLIEYTGNEQIEDSFSFSLLHWFSPIFDSYHWFVTF